MNSFAPALEARLRADAKTWGDAPSAATLARLRRSGRTRGTMLRLACAAAALLAVATLAWPRPPAPPAPRTALPVAELEALALAPLEQELSSLVQDGRTAAERVLRQVPAPLRSLLGI